MLLINPGEIARLSLRNDQVISLVSETGDGIHRQVGPLKVTTYELPETWLGGYSLEMNPLIALLRYDIKSKTSAFKGVPVRIVPVSA